MLTLLADKSPIIVGLIAQADVKDARIKISVSRVPRHDIAATYILEPKTDSEIDLGSGLVFSKSPSIGSTSRKNAR